MIPEPEKQRQEIVSPTKLATGLVFFFFTLLIILAGKIPIAIETTVLSLLGLHEFYNLAEKKNSRPLRVAGLTAGLLLAVCLCFFGLQTNVILLLTGLSIFILTYKLFKNDSFNIFSDISVTNLGLVYVCFTLQHITLLGSLNNGTGYVLFMVAVNSFSDASAQIIGKTFGKHKLYPKVSPNKTIEGAVGGILGSVVFGFVLFLIIQHFRLCQLPLIHAVILSLLISISGQIGDLVESLVKREVNEKDSGNIVLGHGGVLDRLDSLTFSAVFTFYYVLYIIKP